MPECSVRYVLLEDKHFQKKERKWEGDRQQTKSSKINEARALTSTAVILQHSVDPEKCLTVDRL